MITRPAKPLQGLRFGRLLVIERGPKHFHFAQWRCRCDCGNETILTSNELLRKKGATQSCGCLAKELAITRGKLAITHGDARRGAHTPEYDCWCRMRARCDNPNESQYPNYGGRGITMCQEWRDSYPAFLAHVGRRPSPDHSIDRINNEGNYEPGNVRWATSIEQRVNQRSTKLTPDSVRLIRRALAEGHRQKDLAVEYGISTTIICHIANGKRWAHVK